MKPLSLIALACLLTGTACNRTSTSPPPADAADGNLAPAADTGVPAAVQDADASVAPADTQLMEAPAPPPPLPDYSQPPCPGEDYLWTPGYWDYASSGYYWVPGAWVEAPYVGALWTPPWWGFDNGVYLFHAGYWGPHIGFYGGIDYGFGYTGRGYYGASWRNGSVFYNRSITNINTRVVHNTYDYRVSSPRGERFAYNGGRGIQAQPSPQELAAHRDPHHAPVAAQEEHVRAAAADRQQFAAGGHARPGRLVAERPLNTGNRAPAGNAPEAARPFEPVPRPGERPPSAPANRAAPPEGRPGPESARPFEPAPAPAGRAPVRPQSEPANRHIAPESHPAERAPQPRPEARTPESARPFETAPRPAQRPPAAPHSQPANRPAAPETRTAPRTEPPSSARPAAGPPPQEQRANRMARPQPENHPAPPAHPQPHAAPPSHEAPHPPKPPEKKKGG